MKFFLWKVFTDLYTILWFACSYSQAKWLYMLTCACVKQYQKTPFYFCMYAFAVVHVHHSIREMKVNLGK